MKKYTHYAFALFILLLQSCSAIFIHTPDKVNAPGLAKKGEVKLDGSLKLQHTAEKGSPVSLSADGAVAITDHIGIIASYRGVNYRSIVDEQDGGWLFGSHYYEFLLNGHRGDVGVGYFAQINHHAKFETYVGGGMGYLKNSISSDIEPYRTTYNNVFSQIAYCHFNHSYSITLGFRMSILRYSSFRFEDKAYPSYPNEPVDHITHHIFSYYTPFTQLQVGRGAVKFNMQLGLELGMNSADVTYSTSPIYMTAGAAIHLPAKRHAAKDKSQRY